MISRRSVWLHRYAMVTVGATFVLICAGGLVTSTGSGLAVPDWPLSFGQFFPPLVGGVLYEHGHRLIAAFVGILTVALVLWIWMCDTRVWVRGLSVGALMTLLLQGLLGGITVLWGLPTVVSVAHATLAQVFFSAMVLLAAATHSEGRGVIPRLPPVVPWVCALTTLVVFFQLIVGALMRHTGAGLAIPDFPLAFGRLIPPFFSEGVAIHFVHRVGALVVLICVGVVLALTVRCRHTASHLQYPLRVMGGLVLFQIALGALTIWTQRAVLPTTAHVAVGAALLATSLLVTLRSYASWGEPIRGEVPRSMSVDPGDRARQVPA